MPNIIVGETIEKQRHGKTVAEALIKIGDFPIAYSILREREKFDVDEDKFTVVMHLTKDEREELLDVLVKKAVELVGLTEGIEASEKQIKNVLQKKLKCIDEDADLYKIEANCKMGYENPEGEVVRLPLIVKGPDNEELKTKLLTNGSRGFANFMLTPMINPKTGGLAFPFQLRAVKVSKVVPYERDESDAPKIQFDDFSDIDVDY